MSGSSSSNGGGGFRAKLEHFLYSGDKKHVVAGMAIIGALFGVPWYFMNRGNGDLELEGNAELRATTGLLGCCGLGTCLVLDQLIPLGFISLRVVKGCASLSNKIVALDQSHYSQDV
nr:uncharacterized protein LOC112514673 [Ipomoea batatas]GMD32470.1 uncharacterized protein LOC112514673 [Ipomoea batatas]